MDKATISLAEDDRGGSVVPSSVTTSVALRACDECRARKIRCDRKRPCGHCRTASLSCRTTVQRPEQRSRVMVTKQYENKIDRIADRLASIEQLLRDGARDTLRSPASDEATSVPEVTSTETADDIMPGIHSIGYTGPKAETLAAKDALEQTLESNPVIRQDHQLGTALAALHNMVGRLDFDVEASVDHPNQIKLLHAALPAWAEVEKILYDAEEMNCLTFKLCIPGLTITQFSTLSKELYDNSESMSPIRRLLVYSGLFAACTELSAVCSGDDPAYYHDMMEPFQQRVMVAVRNLPLVISPTKEAVDALLAASFIAIDMCKPTLSWYLSYAAAGVCQTLGYNRLPPILEDGPEEQKQKVALFWMVYVMDRSNSLRLGRAPAIHDSYISLSKPTPSLQFNKSIVHLFQFWIEVASIQGKVCEQLYSPMALAQVPAERRCIAETLANDLRSVYRMRVAADDEIKPLLETSIANLAHLIAGGDSIMFYSVLTMILRAIPTNHGAPSPALEAARQCLQISRDLANESGRNVYCWTVHCHWVTLNTPLTPFTVLFCHVIANHHNVREDLNLIRDYVLSLRPACELSDGIGKFYRMCSVFWKVAEAYVSAKQSEEASRLQDIPNTTQNLESVMGEFDGYLSSLGFAPVTQVFDVNDADLGAADAELSSDLYDWFTGNASLYGLLEQNLDGLDIPGFDVVPAAQDYGSNLG